VEPAGDRLEVATAEQHGANRLVSGRGAREIEADVETCAIAMRAGSTKKRRRLAIWLPASLVSNSTLRLLRRGRPVSGVALVDSGVDRAV
jgi:hypothetical protein